MSSSSSNMGSGRVVVDTSLLAFAFFFAFSFAFSFASAFASGGLLPLSGHVAQVVASATTCAFPFASAFGFSVGSFPTLRLATVNRIGREDDFLLRLSIRFVVRVVVRGGGGLGLGVVIRIASLLAIAFALSLGLLVQVLVAFEDKFEHLVESLCLVIGQSTTDEVV
eukprot:CAMPEP_0206479724 /NCGR_PEP_ID=MMETSP0324_2-20121206/36840_1 /ASSEMBLY_ACC=CAM_ASM_000836 /TAXON_ID=2866 /ORGANISM="Crypthecodinium cohnii, Strain Seligo" /LENGTH=166 /DNA_ID=CAMNT_0053956317 /DNA_START=57 /DNA_END=557 /DNA_ORIENTATION=+